MSLINSVLTVIFLVIRVTVARITLSGLVSESRLDGGAFVFKGAFDDWGQIIFRFVLESVLHAYFLGSKEKMILKHTVAVAVVVVAWLLAPFGV